MTGGLERLRSLMRDVGYPARAGRLYRQMLRDFDALREMLEGEERPTWRMVSVSYGGPDTTAGGNIASSTWVRVMRRKGLREPRKVKDRSSAPKVRTSEPELRTPVPAEEPSARALRPIPPFKTARERNWKGDN